MLKPGESCSPFLFRLLVGGSSIRSQRPIWDGGLPRRNLRPKKTNNFRLLASLHLLVPLSPLPLPLSRLRKCVPFLGSKCRSSPSPQRREKMPASHGTRLGIPSVIARSLAARISSGCLVEDSNPFGQHRLLRGAGELQLLRLLTLSESWHCLPKSSPPLFP